MFKLDKNNYDNTFYLLSDAQFVKIQRSKQYNDSSARYRCNIIDV